MTTLRGFFPKGFLRKNPRKVYVTDVTHKVQRTVIFVAKPINRSVKVQRTDTLERQYFGALHLNSTIN